MNTPLELLERELSSLKFTASASMTRGLKKAAKDMIPQYEAAIKLLKRTPNAQASVATEADSSNVPDPQSAQKEPVIDNLRDKFFKECTDNDDQDDRNPFKPFMSKVNMAPHDLFEWFKPYLKSKGEPVIDWEALEGDCQEWCHSFNAVPWPKTVVEWLKDHLSNYIKTGK